MKSMIFWFLSILIVILVSSCSAPRHNSYPQGRGYQSQQGAYPPRGGYEEQMQQEEEAKRQEAAAQSRKAAGELLPGLIELRNQMIRQQNKK